VPCRPRLLLGVEVRRLLLGGCRVVGLLAVARTDGLLVCEIVAAAAPSVIVIVVRLVDLAEVLLIVVRFLAFDLITTLLATFVALAVTKTEVNFV